MRYSLFIPSLPRYLLRNRQQQPTSTTTLVCIASKFVQKTTPFQEAGSNKSRTYIEQNPSKFQKNHQSCSNTTKTIKARQTKFQIKAIKQLTILKVSK
jgi:hypothetical protein